MNKKNMMNNRIFRIVVLWSMLSVSLFSAEKSILFIGNSFTMRHDIPKLVKTLLEEGDRENTVKTEIVGYGGRNLFCHWEMCRSYNRLKANNLTKEQWESEIAALFDQWNNALQSGDPDKVAALYAEQSVLLPTVSNEPRFTLDEKLDYFRHFLEKQPSAKIDSRHIDIGCDMAADSGIYTFTLAKSAEIIRARYSFVYQCDGLRWRIISHHSSLMPETK